MWQSVLKTGSLGPTYIVDLSRSPTSSLLHSDLGYQLVVVGHHLAYIVAILVVSPQPRAATP